MQLSAEKQHLLNRRLQQSIQPLAIIGAAIISTLTFTVVFWSLCFEVRYTDQSTSTVVCIIFAVLALLLSVAAFQQYRHHHHSRTLIVFAVLTWIALVAGSNFGDRYWFKHTMSYFNIKDMGSYVNIDPYLDKGTSYMDAGVLYFKEGSHVLTSKALAFKNGLTYCVAPIVRAPIVGSKESDELQTLTGFTAPGSGTVDFWAVGTNCCGRDASDFTCGNVDSKVARSGMRLLDEASRSMYLLAVQEWSATTGLPVRHPLFFEWVADPIVHQERILATAEEDIWVYCSATFFMALIASFVLHAFLQKLRVH